MRFSPALKTDRGPELQKHQICDSFSRSFLPVTPSPCPILPPPHQSVEETKMGHPTFRRNLPAPNLHEEPPAPQPSGGAPCTPTFRRNLPVPNLQEEPPCTPTFRSPLHPNLQEEPPYTPTFRRNLPAPQPSGGAPLHPNLQEEAPTPQPSGGAPRTPTFRRRPPHPNLQEEPPCTPTFRRAQQSQEELTSSSSPLVSSLQGGGPLARSRVRGAMVLMDPGKGIG